MAQQRRGGVIQLQVDGSIIEVVGSWSYKLSGVTREALMGADGFHGYKEIPHPGYIEGEIRDRDDLDVQKLMNATNVTATLTLANGKVIRAKDAFAAGDWEGNTEEGTLTARFESGSVREVK
jgi:Phage tail tube protein